jgi:hypothetical protein
MSEQRNERIPVLEAYEDPQRVCDEDTVPTQTGDEDTPDTEDTLDKIRDLPWVDLVAETDREDASHYVEPNVGVIAMDTEVHELENLGLEVVSVSLTTERVYVRVRNAHRDEGP